MLAKTQQNCMTKLKPTQPTDGNLLKKFRVWLKRFGAKDNERIGVIFDIEYGAMLVLPNI
jgi:hypothetical protein